MPDSIQLLNISLPRSNGLNQTDIVKVIHSQRITEVPIRASYFDVVNRLPYWVLKASGIYAMNWAQFMMLLVTLYYVAEFSRVLRLRALRGQRLRQIMSDNFQLTGRFN